MSDHRTDPDEVDLQIRAIERVARATPPPSPALQELGDSLRALSRWMLVTEDEERIAHAASVLASLSGELGADGSTALSRFNTPLPEDPDEPEDPEVPEDPEDPESTELSLRADLSAP